jgi:hypothetical protein
MTPIDFKNNTINIKQNEKEIIPKQLPILQDIERKQDKVIYYIPIINKLKEQFDLALKIFNEPNIELLKRYPDDVEDWIHRYVAAGIVMKNLSKYSILINESNPINEETLKILLIDHIIDNLLPSDKLDLFQYIIQQETITDSFIELLKNNINNKLFILEDGLGYILYLKKSKEIKSSYFFINKETNWMFVKAKQSHIIEMNNIISKMNQTIINKKINKIIGFVEEKTEKNMVFKTKIIEQTKMKKLQNGRICDQAGKQPQIDLLNEIVEKKIYENILLYTLLKDAPMPQKISLITNFRL